MRMRALGSACSSRISLPVSLRKASSNVSVPVCASFESILGLSTVLFGFTPPDGQFHAPNEWMWMSNYETGIEAIARYWDEISGLETT